MGEYLHELAREGLAQGTIRTRASILEGFAVFADSQDVRRRQPLRISEVDRQLVATWTDWEIDRGIARSTLSSRSGVVQAFVKFAADEYPYLLRPFRRVKVRAGAKTKPDPPTIGQADACLQAMREIIPGHAGARVGDAIRGAIIMRYTGLRPYQTARLDWADFDLDAEEMRVRPELGKTRREQAGRTVPVSPVLCEIMGGWGVREGLVISGLNHITLKKWVHRGWVASNVAPTVYQGQSNKGFRACWQTYLRSQGVQLDVIRFLVGHALGGATDSYVGSRAFMEEARVAVALVPAEGLSNVVTLNSEVRR